MREVYIFDIDGCITPPIFLNFNSKGSRENIVKDAIKNGNNVKLYPDFVKFYEKNCVQTEFIYFITGRKKSEFGKLTENQLQSLANIRAFQIIYYPEGKSHKKRKYFTWKVKKIKEVIKNLVYNKISYENSKKIFKFSIFDDMDDYFSRLNKTKFGVEIQLILIENESSWKELF